MARNYSPRKKRNKIISSPNQRIISHYFTPRSGINKEEVNFLVKAAANGGKRYPTTGVQGRTDQITFSPAFGFTTAAKVHQQAEGCYSRTENQPILSGQRNLGSTTCKCAVSGLVTCACSPLKNSSSDKKQTHFDLTRVFGFMASSTSSSSSSPTSNSSSSSCPSPRNTRRTRRSNSSAQNHLKGKSAKKQKRVPETITVESEDENCTSDDDCCVIMNVVRGRKLKSDSEVEESSSCSQSSTSTESSSQESKGESSYKSSSSSESDQKNTASSCKKSSLSSKSVGQTKEQASAKSTFGLVGGDVSDSDDDDDEDSQDLSQCDSDFAQLPVEIMENIFCQLPIVDLMLNCALVCHQWYDIISRASVMALIIILRCIVA